MHDLAGYITPLLKENRTQRAPGAEKAIQMEQGDIIVLHNYYTTGTNRVMQLIKLWKPRNNEVGAETRNNLCFAVYNSLRMSFDHEEAMERLRLYNSGFKKLMTDLELDHTVCSAARKGGYKYTSKKLIELLEITERYVRFPLPAP